MTLDDIENSLFLGKKSVDEALTLVDSYLARKNTNPDKAFAIRQIVGVIHDRLDRIAPQIINQIAINERYKKYVKSVIHDGKIVDTVGAVTSLMDLVVQDSNKRILDAKEPATKRNREFEKNEVVRFFRNIAAPMLMYYEIYNLFCDIKDEINRT